ncbi:hypothetical protein NL53_09180 [Vibrio variabilis]|uniref:DUF1566 domain-containing protein n=1 Tax=Vibrio variabilis TaxID=990271 RepID=A0ABR4YBC2_9VIBR|nr:DUF1566 domain-containing protein [Vibrio variabilis]KHA60781.1 hypothetical protein NL53_09180 [Vibrio variabilis]
MLFRRIAMTALLGVSLTGCSEGPNTGSDSTSGSGNGTPAPSTPGNPNQPNPGTPPTSGGQTGTAPTPPVAIRDITITGPIPQAIDTDLFEFKVCAATVCDTWRSGVSNGSYEYTFDSSQWPTDQPVILEGWYTGQQVIVSDAQRAGTLASNGTSTSNPFTQRKYFKTELGSLANLVQMDSSGDGVVDESELITLSLDPVTQAFLTVSNHLLASQLSQHADLPVRQRHEAVRRYLSEQSRSSWIYLTEVQRTQISEHMKTTGQHSFRPSYYDSYTLSLTPEQWAAIKGDINTPAERQVVELNIAQLKNIHPVNHGRGMTNWQFRLTTQQLAQARGELVYTQQLVIELASIYQQMFGKEEEKLTLSWSQESALKKHVAIANPGDGEPTIFDTPFELVLNDAWKGSQYEQLGLFDAFDPNSGKGTPVTWTLSGDDIAAIYQRHKQAVAADPDNRHPKYIPLPDRTWPGGGEGMQDLGIKILTSLNARPKEPIWKHYQQQVASTVPTHSEMNLSSEQQLLMRQQRSWGALEYANYFHPLKNSLMGIAPEMHLKISGRFPAELEEAAVEVVLGSRINKSKDEDYYGRQPIGRHEPITLITRDGLRKKSIDYTGNNGFSFTIPLRNIDNNLERCAPGKPDIPNKSFEHNYEYTEDEMNDTLTIHVRDNKTGVVLRSVLGSFCELVELDSNGNDTIEISELERLSVGYISSAQSALLFKTSLSKLGYAGYLYPLTLEDISSRLKAFPRQQVEFLAAVFALQVEGRLFGHSIDLVESGDIYMDVLALLDIDMLAEWGMVSSNNQMPDLELLQTRFGAKYAIGEMLTNNLDINVSHITQNMTQLLANSKEDEYYFEFTRPGSWVSVYPVSTLDLTCQMVLDADQILGVRIDGQGENEQGHWVTIGWDEQAGATRYTLGWGESHFEQVADAKHQKETHETRMTITGLAFERLYRIRVQSNIGSPSSLLTYSPKLIHVADTRVTEGTRMDDSHRGRDSDNQCDPLSGKAKNSNNDGLLGARYIKLDEEGTPLVRQDLTYDQRPFACVLDAQTGLVWETKHERKEGEPYSIFDGSNMFVMDPSGMEDVFDGACALSDLNVVSTDPHKCSVANQISWVNGAKRCGLSNWRLPTLQEGYALFDFSESQKMNLDTRYFPNLRFPRMDMSTFHGFWLDAESLDGNKHRALSAVWLDVGYFENTKHNPLLLVSDGYYAE